MSAQGTLDFTLSNARRFYSSMGNPLDGKGLRERNLWIFWNSCWHPLGFEKAFSFFHTFEWQSVKAADTYKFLIVVSNSVIRLTKRIETFFLCKGIIFIHLKPKNWKRHTTNSTLLCHWNVYFTQPYFWVPFAVWFLFSLSFFPFPLLTTTWYNFNKFKQN